MFITVFVCGSLMSILLVDKFLCSCLEMLHLFIVQLSVNHVYGAVHGRHFWTPFNGVAEVDISGFGLNITVFTIAGVCAAPSTSLWLETPSRLGASAAVTANTTEAKTTRARARTTERILVANCSLLLISAIVTNV